jgi:hypothetical protein
MLPILAGQTRLFSGRYLVAPSLGIHNPLLLKHSQKSGTLYFPLIKRLTAELRS